MRPELGVLSVSLSACCIDACERIPRCSTTALLRANPAVWLLARQKLYVAAEQALLLYLQHALILPSNHEEPIARDYFVQKREPLMCS